MPDEIHHVFDQNTFFPQLYRDLEKAQHLVLIQSPFISVRQLKIVGPSIAKCCRRGVRLCVFIQQPAGWPKDKNSPTLRSFKDAIDLLQSLGAHATLRRKVHEKLIVIDDRLFWDGSLNALSHYDTSERMTRWQSIQKVEHAILKHNLISCSQCLQSDIHSLFSPALSCETLQKVVGQYISVARKARGLTQLELAKDANLQRKVISQIELGNRNFELKTLLRVCLVLGISPLLVPRHVLPAIGDVLRRDFVDPRAENDLIR